MNFFFDKIPLVVLIVGICMLMLYPYIGAGLMLAALCFRAERYGLMAACFVICILLQSIMGKRILTHHVDVGPSRASQKKEEKGKPPKKRRKKKKKVQEVPAPEVAEVQDVTVVPAEEVAETQEVLEASNEVSFEAQAVSEAPSVEDDLVNEEPQESKTSEDIGANEPKNIEDKEVSNLPVAGVGVE